MIIISQVKQGELKASSKKEHLPSCAILQCSRKSRASLQHQICFISVSLLQRSLLKLRKCTTCNHLHRKLHFLTQAEVLGTESKLKATGSRLEFSWAVSAQDLNIEVEISLGRALCSMQQAIRSPQGLQKWHKADIFVREILSNIRQK